MNIKVITLNVWQGNLLDDAITFLQSEDADIVLLQEVYTSDNNIFEHKYQTYQELITKLDYAYYLHAPMVEDQYAFGNVVQGNAILSKFPLTERETVFFAEPFASRDPDDPKSWPVTPRNLQHATAHIDGLDIELFNLHGVWDLEGDSFSPKRQKMSQAIIDAVSGYENVILGGDTNANPINQAMVAVEDHLDSVFGHSLKSTFNMRHKSNGGYAVSAVDMIFVSKNFEVLSKDCPNVDVSDHLPLITTLQLAA